MEELIKTHKQDLHNLVEKMKASGKLPPPFAFVATNKIFNGARAHVTLPINYFLANATMSHSEVLATLFSGLLGTDCDCGNIHTSHIGMALPVLVETYGLNDEEWAEFHKKNDGREMTNQEVAKLSAEGKVVVAYMTLSTQGFVITSMSMPGNSEVEFMNTNEQPFEGGKFDAKVLQDALATIIDERPGAKKEKATENAK
jgi:hypothetical protein